MPMLHKRLFDPVVRQILARRWGLILRVGGLCAGYGGLEMGLARVLDCEPAWFCEYADGPSKILAHHYPDIPNHHDLTATDWGAVEPVDIVTAGWPCQPWSNAGKRKGADDERAIWPAIAGAVRALRPRYVALENVSAIVAAGELARAVGDLAACGYDTQWVCVRASDVGAPHQRERIFVLASDTECSRRERGTLQRGWASGDVAGNGSGVAADTEEVGWGRRCEPALAGTSHGRRGDADHPRPAADADESGPQGPQPAWRRHVPDGSAATDAQGHGRHEGWTESAGIVGGPDAAQRSTATTPDTICGGRNGRTFHPQRNKSERTTTSRSSEVDWGAYRPAIERWERIIGRPAPNPTQPGPRGGQRLSPLLVEWMMGLPQGWVTGVPDLSRNEQLKALGNGVVPQQAAASFRHLLHVAEMAS